MTSTGIQELLYLSDNAFAGEDWHSLLTNLRDVTPEMWGRIPPGGQRSIRDIVEHVGGCKYMYENHAFGDGTLTWDDPPAAGNGVMANKDSAIAWLRDGHGQLGQSIAKLDDAELDRPRMTNWGELKETRWIVTTMIQHDLYHAGEINHIRSLLDGDDRWAHDRGYGPTRPTVWC
jgi:uncharacterized damage-inducible protein DinB